MRKEKDRVAVHLGKAERQKMSFVATFLGLLLVLITLQLLFLTINYKTIKLTVCIEFM